MPWKASSVMEERLRFVVRLLEDGEAMTDVCREFGISRKTGYKIFDRYKEHGLEALTDRTRRPVRYANQLPQQLESLIVQLKAEKPHWGARKMGSSWFDDLTAMSGFRPRAPSMPCSIAARSRVSARVSARAARRARRCRSAPPPMTSGVPTSRVSSSSVMGAIATRSP